MKNIFKEFILLTILILYFTYSLLNNSFITEQTIYAFNIWLKKIIPSLLPTFIIVDLINKSNIPYYINKYFHINYIYFISIISGSPTNAYILNMYKEDTTKLLATTKYTSPIFTFTFLKLIFNTKIVLIIMFCNILANVILILLIRPPKIIFMKHNYNLINVFVNSISKNISTLIVILGTIIFFNTLPINLINNVYLKTGLFSILEITSSLNNLVLVNIPLNFKLLFTIISLSTCGLCIECQIKSIITDTYVNYLKYMKYRLYHLILFMFFTLILILIF